MKISIITPTFNSVDCLERAIQSVLIQGYDNYEHIVVDGVSTDGTLDIIKRHKHLRWISEPDTGQVSAMKKGFAMAEGDVLVNLNADDYFLEGAFSAVVPHLEAGEKVVMGKVLVKTEKGDGIAEWINDPKYDIEDMVRHWLPNAFCVNPLGFFYPREYQKEIELDETDKQDLQLLLELGLRCRFKKIDKVLGVYNNTFDTKTARAQLDPDCWTNEKFYFIEWAAKRIPGLDLERFELDRQRGYQLRRRMTLWDAFGMGRAEKLAKQGKFFLLPVDEEEAHTSRSNFVEHRHLGTKNDWIIPVMSPGKVASKSVCAALKSLAPEILPAQVYHLHQFVKSHLIHQLPGLDHLAVSLALKNLYDSKGDHLVWKFICGVREPVALAISGAFETLKRKISVEESGEYAKSTVLPYIYQYFPVQYGIGVGINVFDYPFDIKAGYGIIRNGNVEILIYRMESIDKCFSQAINEYLGIQDLILPRVNVGEEKGYAASYKLAKKELKFEEQFLDSVYSSDFAKHFYSENELQVFKQKWIRS